VDETADKIVIVTVKNLDTQTFESIGESDSARYINSTFDSLTRLTFV
jgi:hypothetical protein